MFGQWSELGANLLTIGVCMYDLCRAIPLGAGVTF